MSVMTRRVGDSEVHRNLRRKNLAVFAALIAFCVLIYVVTLVRLGAG